MKLPARYIAIDLETTDISPARGDVIQIGAVALDRELNSVAFFNRYIQPTSPWRNPEATAVHQIPEEVLAKAEKPHDVLKAFELFAIKNAGGRPIIAAWGAYFDVEFLKAYYQKIGRNYPFSFKCFDLKTIAIWEASKRDQESTGGLGAFVERQQLEFEGRPHDAFADIMNAVRVVRSYLK